MSDSKAAVINIANSIDEYWSTHPELHDIPIYYASSLAKKCMAVYQTYVNAMNDRIKRQIAVNNPFVFKYISNLKVGISTILGRNKNNRCVYKRNSNGRYRE